MENIAFSIRWLTARQLTVQEQKCTYVRNHVNMAMNSNRSKLSGQKVSKLSYISLVGFPVITDDTYKLQSPV